ncbi:unnamed protein product [Brassica oleracea]
MAEETVRIRLVFENQRILSKHQKKQGLKRSWAVLNPKYHRTVSEFSNHILYTFSLFEACPHGLSLYMDGFVLPPFESSCVLKDKDIVWLVSPCLGLVMHFLVLKFSFLFCSVKRKKEPLLEIVGEDSEENVCAAIEIEERRARICPDAVLIGNEETGGYESDSEEEEEIVAEKKTSKKRKASSKSLTSKRKKCKLATTEETPLEREDAAVVNKSNDVKKKRKTLDVQRDENDEHNDANAKSMNKSKKSSLQEESNESDELCNMSAETKKTPSRSARRKKAKRQWLREKTKQEKEELQQKEMQMVVAPSQKPAITIDHQETEENHSESPEKQEPDEHGDGVGDEVVPVEVRPGHIRFKPLDESDEASPETEPPSENFLWNGNMTKKKGQKWGTEKTGFSKRYAWDLNDTYHQTQPAEAETLANCQIDYEQLVAYTGSVKKGDIIAYRLIELTSSWTPEVSSFRVGKISYYDPVSKMVTLMPVQGYPIEKKIEEDDDSSMQADTSLYNEDGSLESVIQSRPLPTGIDFNRLFSGIARTKQMELNGISHDLYMLGIVINCFCRCRKLGFAFSAMGKIFKLGYEPNTVTFNTLLNGLCLEGRVFEAVELVDCMVLTQHVPDLITLNTLVNGLCLQDGLSEAMSLIDRMVANGCQPNQLFRKMSLRGMIADTVTYSTLIQGFCQSRKLIVAKEVFQEMIDDAWDLFCSLSLKGVKRDIQSYNIMLSGLFKRSSLSEADALFRKMKEDGYEPDGCTYNTLIRAHLRGSDITTSVQLIEEMKRCGFSSDASTVKIVMDMLSSGELDKSFLNMLSGPFGDKSSSLD